MLAKAAGEKISDTQAKQLLQALQSVLHDPVFGKLSPCTIAGVHAALTPHADRLAPLSTKRVKYPVCAPDEDGCCDAADITAPISKRTKNPLAVIRVAQPYEGVWIYATMYNFGNSFASSPLRTYDRMPTFPTHMQAIQAGAKNLERQLSGQSTSKQKERPVVMTWLADLLQMPDPDWTEEMAQETTN
ncbi:hypothetical protein [Paraburkholderia lacunae]|uniref:hypothetical protein n=1 Tax=Paraburkholderia lacunae TaxID=2211104 RepID=UPI001AD834B3|nr:hypothetical protein [Paraburkholderia lacunae]